MKLQCYIVANIILITNLKADVDNKEMSDILHRQQQQQSVELVVIT